MKKALFLALLALATSLSIFACEKEEHQHDAEISILAPTAGQTFSLNQTVSIQADITSEEELHGWEITLRKKSDNTVLYTTDEHTHGTTLQIREQWVNNVANHTDVVLEVKAALDHAGSDFKTATVEFHCHPN
jgi:hypothetical protein